MADPESPGGPQETTKPKEPEEEKPDEIPYLIDLLMHPELNVRWRAAEALGEARDVRAVESLIAALKDPFQDVSWIAAEALGKIRDPRAVEPLIAALKEGEKWLR
ncbi:MAG: HEAT repeat domain-containing protein, partial [Methanomicrobiales archaeon]|nr:HEAT repeat domain-containing protein [Methanomicrobiales archaeon]